MQLFNKFFRYVLWYMYFDIYVKVIYSMNIEIILKVKIVARVEYKKAKFVPRIIRKEKFKTSKTYKKQE